jgi:hypothetical protein
MITVMVLQTGLPFILILWLVVLPPRNLAGFWMLAFAAASMTFAVVKLGIWVFPPWWVPYVMGVLLVGAVALHLIRSQHRALLPKAAFGWLSLAALTGIAGFAVAQTRAASVGTRMPNGPSIDLAWPLGPGIYLVANGGTMPAINAHAALLDASHILHAGFRGSGYGVDLIAVDHWGLRASGILPKDPASYVIFGTPVFAPCAGQVTQAAGGNPDMPVPEMDEDNPVGNHVLLRCGGIDVLLGHFRQGTLRVAVGDSVTVGQQIGEAGNSGESSEPHLHIHAQMPGPPDAPFAADPVAMRLGGQFLVRGNIVDMSARAP